MRPIKNWNEVRAMGERRNLPPGGYICRILDGKVARYEGRDGAFEKLELSFDIAEGEFEGFYADDYRSQNMEDKKWKGVLRLYVPSDDGSERDEWTKRKLKAAIEAVEESNGNYHWDWDETSLKGKLVGCLFQNQEWEFNGRSGWKSQPVRFVSVDEIREERFKVPEDKPINRIVASPVGGQGMVDTFSAISDEDLPF